MLLCNKVPLHGKRSWCILSVGGWEVAVRGVALLLSPTSFWLPHPPCKLSQRQIKKNVSSGASWFLLLLPLLQWFTSLSLLVALLTPVSLTECSANVHCACDGWGFKFFTKGASFCQLITWTHLHVKTICNRSSSSSAIHCKNKGRLKKSLESKILATSFHMQLGDVAAAAAADLEGCLLVVWHKITCSLTHEQTKAQGP